MRESGPHLVALLGTSLGGDGPLYSQLIDALKHAVDRGAIPLGTVLPPERALARSLNVSRSTVVKAYDHLKAEGWLESRQGSSTWVRRPAPDRSKFDAVSTSRVFLAPDGATQRSEPGRAREDATSVDLSIAALPASPVVRRLLATLDPDALAELTAHHGYVPQGLALLRAAVAGLLASEGLATSEDQVVITSGAHQAISLIARQVLEPGDRVLVESPTFAGALDVFRRFGARAVPLPVDADGARGDLVEELVARTDARLLYLAPHFHNPTGVVVPLERRAAIAEVARRTGLVVIEDLAMGDLDLDLAGGGTAAPLPPTIASLAPDAAVHTIGSTSKLFWAGLRIGWVRSPEDWTARMLATKTVADLGSPLISQLLAVDLLATRDVVRRERADELAPRRDLVMRLIAEDLPDWTATRPRGGLSVWAEMPAGNALEFAEVAARHGVTFVPGPSLSVDEGNRRAVRIVYTQPEDVLAEGIERLAAAWRTYAPDLGRSPARLLV